MGAWRGVLFAPPEPDEVGAGALEGRAGVASPPPKSMSSAVASGTLPVRAPEPGSPLLATLVTDPAISAIVADCWRRGTVVS